MVKCAWCKIPTKQIYTIGSYFKQSLCPVCAEKHYNTVIPKLENHIQEVRNGMSNRRKSLTKLKQEMCKHEHLVNTCYSKFFAPMVMKSIYRCEDCGKEIYK